MVRSCHILLVAGGRLGVLAALTLLVGCLLDSSARGRPRTEYSCEAVVRNAAGHIERVRTGDSEFGERRVFSQCPAGEAESQDLQWRRHLAEELDPGPFRDHANGWCAQALNCEEIIVEAEEASLECPAFAATLEPLQLCPASSGGCVIHTPSPLDFGAHPIGEGFAVETLSFENTCDEAVRFYADATGLSNDSRSEFAIQSNNCAATGPVEGHELTAYGTAGDGCTVDISYTPKNPGAVEIDFHVWEGSQGLPTVILRGEGIGSAPRPVDATPAYCVDPGLDDCATVAIGIVADGPGGFRLVDDADLDRSRSTGFSLVAADLPGRNEVFAAGVPAVFQVQWCSSLTTEPEERTTLSVTTTTETEASETLIFDIQGGGCS